MHKASKPILFSILLVSLVAAFASANSAAGSRALGGSGAIAIAPHQDATPTPSEADGSVAGSTDTIMWMALAIVVIALLPVITRRSFWH